MIRGCIFDLDGVVVDTAVYHYQAWRRLAATLDFEFTENHNERLKGVSRMDSLEILLEVGGIKLPDEEKVRLAGVKNNWYLEYIRRMTPAEILPGVTDFLDLLKDHGFRVALGTASRNASLILKQIRLETTFDAVIDGSQVSRAKPDPEVFLKAADAIRLPPDQCIVFEDAIAGIEAARRAGMKSIGIGQPDILIQADKVISGFVNADLSLLQF